MDNILTYTQIERQEQIEAAIHAMLEEVAGRELKWDDSHHSLIGAIRDLVSDEFSKQGIMLEKEFYPFAEGSSSQSNRSHAPARRQSSVEKMGMAGDPHRRLAGMDPGKRGGVKRRRCNEQ